MATVAEVVVQRLRDVGVRTLFGVPGGGSNLDLIAAAERAGLPFVLTSTETASAIAAVAQAEITGAPGACLTTLGPGAASVVNGVACAFLDRAPIVVFTDSHAVTDGDGYPHQKIDHQSLFAGITRYSGALAASSPLLSLNAALQAIEETPGPAHIDCPANVSLTASIKPEQMFDGTGGISSWTSVTFSSRQETSIDDALRQARKPLVIVGLG